MTHQEHDAGFLTLSNLLSLARIPLGVVFLATPDPNWLAVIILAAAATDALDGFIARVSGTQSHIGLVLDPLCDKVFVLFALTAFLSRGDLSGAGFMLLILRDLYAGGSYLAGRLVGLVIPFRPPDMFRCSCCLSAWSRSFRSSTTATAPCEETGASRRPDTPRDDPRAAVVR
jgi:phosphatidylglycerophosphate synthase